MAKAKKTKLVKARSDIDPNDPMSAFFKADQDIGMGQVYARVRHDILGRFKEICKANGITVYKGTELAYQLLIKEYDERKKKT